MTHHLPRNPLAASTPLAGSTSPAGRISSVARRASVGLAAAALVGSSLAALPAAPSHAAPSSPTPSAPTSSTPAPVRPGHTQLKLTAGTGSVVVAGTSHKVLAQLAPTRTTFTMAGLTWKTLTGSPILQVRVQTSAGWQPWKTLEAEPDGASPNEVSRGGTDLSYFGESTAVEARILGDASSTVGDVRLSAIDSRAVEQDTAVTAQTQQRMSAAATSLTNTPAQPTITSRAQWGADESLLSYNGAGCITPTIDDTIKAAAVHHTEGTNTYTAAQSASIVRGIYAFHVKDRGWCDVGYNFLVDKYGQIFEGRHGGVINPVHGAHATYWNTNTVGISVMMDSMTVRPSSAAMNSLSSLIAWKLAGNYRDPLSTLTMAGTKINRIFRHGDVMETDCPGTYITAYMPTLRTQVAAKMGTWQTPIYKAWQAQGGESGSLGSPHVLERAWNGGRTTTFTGGGIFQTPGGQTFWMGSSINSRYLASGAFATLGWPVANQAAGSIAGQSFVKFAKGTIWTSPATGAHITTGVVDAWIKANPTNFAKLGSPTGEAVTTAIGGRQTFLNGTLTWTGTTVKMVLASRITGDLNHDGLSDLLTIDSMGRVTWYPTQPGGRAGAAKAGTVLSGAPLTWAAQTPDLNNDGWPELLARRADGTLWAWAGQGNGEYDKPIQIGTGWNAMREINVVPHLNGDGLADIVAVNPAQQLKRYSLGSSMRVTSTTQIGFGWGGMTHVTSVGDIRGVGVSDILAVGQDGKLWDYFGTRQGTLTGDKRQIGFNWNIYNEVHSVGDLNGDGRGDLIGHNTTGAVYGYLNLGGGKWSTRYVLLPDVTKAGLVA